MARVSMLVVLLAVTLMVTTPEVSAEDAEGVRTCVAFKDALEAFSYSGYVPGLRTRLRDVARKGVLSQDAYLRNATAQLSRAGDDELMTWMRVITDICLNRTLSTGTVVIQAPPVPQPTAASRSLPPVTDSTVPPGGLIGATDRLSHSVRGLTERFKELGAAARDARGSMGLPPVPATPTDSSLPRPTAAPATPAPRTTAPPPGMSEREATEQRQRIENASGAKCQQKQYGSGWVTVCE
jgi:hypothetical protein